MEPLRARVQDPRFRRRSAHRAGARSASRRWWSWRARGGGGEQRSVPEASSRTIAERRTSFLARLVPPSRGPPGAVRCRPRARATRLRWRAGCPLERKVAQLFLRGLRGPGPDRPDLRQLRRLDLGGIVIGAAELPDPSQLGGARGRGRRRGPAGAPRAPVGDGRAGGRRVQRVPRPPARQRRRRPA